MWKKKLKNLTAVVYLRREYWRHRGIKEFNKYSDYEFISKKYESLGRPLNLADPKRFTEKLQWLKLFWRNEDMPICSDKYEVRDYLTRHGYSELLNELIFEFDDLDHFVPASLPKQFVIKAAHGSGWNMIVKDKDKVNWFWWKRIMKSWLKQNLYWFGREWNYQNQKPRIIVEKYLEDDSGELRDFKVFCFNGNPQFVQIDENRTSNHKRVYVDCEGKPLPIKDSQAHGIPSQIRFSDVQKEMIQIAADLSKPFPHVRVDFYEQNGRIIFGEMTFFDGSGFYSFDPDEWDYTIGEMLELPTPNYNLELYNRIVEK